MDLRQLVGRYVLGDVRAEDLPDAAADALVEGHDSPSLRELAGSKGRETEDITRLFESSILELGVEKPSIQVAALAWAKRIASDVLSGTVTPYCGAKLIWTEIYTRFPELVRLLPFVGYASEYEDDEANRDNYGRRIVDECKILSETEDPSK